jgi:hypothetical protein
MPRRTLHLVTLLAASLLVLPAQQLPPGSSPQNPEPKDREPTFKGITIPNIPGLPFSATIVLEVERYWPDGSTQTRRTINLIARDSSGRTHNEVRRLMPEYFHGSPELMSVQLFDPATRIRMVYEPALRVAHEQLVPQKPRTAATPNPLLHIDDLGTTTLNGLQAKGTRRTLTVYPGRKGEPIEVEDEYWYSAELHLNLLVRHTDPRLGVETIGVSNLKREEPHASMFLLPPGYKVLEDAQPASPLTSPNSQPPGASLPTEPPS